MDIIEVLELTRELQSWRPEELTIEFHNNGTLPFCSTCADWHETDETHSMTDKDGPLTLSGTFHAPEFVNNFHCYETGATLTATDHQCLDLGLNPLVVEFVVGTTSLFDEDGNRYVYTGSDTL